MKTKPTNNAMPAGSANKRQIKQPSNLAWPTAFHATVFSIGIGMPARHFVLGLRRGRRHRQKSKPSAPPKQPSREVCDA